MGFDIMYIFVTSKGHNMILANSSANAEHAKRTLTLRG